MKGIHGIRAISYIPNELGGMQFVLIANHRIPCNAFVLEFAAGAPDPNETMSQCALRELHVIYIYIYIYIYRKKQDL